jgi:butyrate response factor
VFLQSAAALEASTMQEALVSPANAGRLRFRSALELKPFAFGDQRLASPRYLNLNLNLGGADDALFRCSSPTFSPSFGFSSSPSPLATSSVSLSPTSSASLADDGCDGDGADADAATGHTLRLARLALQYQEVADRYELCLARLADAADDAAALRRENAELRNANADLTRRLALLSGIGKQVAAAAAEEARRLRFGEPKTVPAAKDCATEKPAVLPPKSISVRSIDFLLKMNQPKQVQPPATTPAASNRKHRASNPTKPSSVSPVHASPILTSHLLIGLASDIVAYAP